MNSFYPRMSIILSIIPSTLSLLNFSMHTPTFSMIILDRLNLYLLTCSPNKFD